MVAFTGSQETGRKVGVVAAERLMPPEDVAAAAVFLAGGGARMITGQTLVVDGGYTVQ